MCVFYLSAAKAQKHNKIEKNKALKKRNTL